jgi:hypothetical protein
VTGGTALATHDLTSSVNALEQVPDLFDLADRVDDQFLPAGTQVPQPPPGLVEGSGR